MKTKMINKSLLAIFLAVVFSFGCEKPINEKVDFINVHLFYIDIYSGQVLEVTSDNALVYLDTNNVNFQYHFGTYNFVPRDTIFPFVMGPIFEPSWTVCGRFTKFYPNGDTVIYRGTFLSSEYIELGEVDLILTSGDSPIVDTNSFELILTDLNGIPQEGYHLAIYSDSSIRNTDYYGQDYSISKDVTDFIGSTDLSVPLKGSSIPYYLSGYKIISYQLVDSTVYDTLNIRDRGINEIFINSGAQSLTVSFTQ